MGNLRRRQPGEDAGKRRDREDFDPCPWTAPISRHCFPSPLRIFGAAVQAEFELRNAYFGGSGGAGATSGCGAGILGVRPGAGGTGVEPKDSLRSLSLVKMSMLISLNSTRRF